jgi:outer membrane protein OmpA-like peptidoglycan-associated protein
MAELDVQPKRSGAWWLWLLLLLIAVVMVFFLVKGCNSRTTAVAATQPDWSTVDLATARSTDADISDTTIQVRRSERYTIYSLGENILFATGQSTLQGDAGSKLQQIAASLHKNFKGASIGVYGSTDSTGSTGLNKSLGAERAAAVKNWLVNTGSLDSTKVSIHSLGEAKPVATNATENGRQQNRNVTIVAFTNKN